MQTAKNRIIAASSRDFKVNKLLFVITNLVLFINFIMQMSMRKFITYYSESVTNSYTGYGLAQAGSVAIALCAVFTVFTLFHELYSKPHADLVYSLPSSAPYSSQRISPCTWCQDILQCLCSQSLPQAFS